MRRQNRVHSLRQDRPAVNTPGSLEVPWLGTLPVAVCVPQAEDGDGGHLRIQLKNEAVAQTVFLSRMLWNG